MLIILLSSIAAISGLAIVLIGIKILSPILILFGFIEVIIGATIMMLLSKGK